MERRKENEFPELVAHTLPQLLRKIPVGETRRVGEGMNPVSVRRACSDLKKEGLMFVTSTKLGLMTVTRLT